MRKHRRNSYWDRYGDLWQQLRSHAQERHEVETEEQRLYGRLLRRDRYEMGDCPESPYDGSHLYLPIRGIMIEYTGRLLKLDGYTGMVDVIEVEFRFGIRPAALLRKIDTDDSYFASEFTVRELQ